MNALKARGGEPPRAFSASWNNPVPLVGLASLTGPLALVVGNEGKGLSRLVRKHCDLLIKLPMHGTINSLNAAVAGSIALYEALRQRNSKKA